jgi:F-type H+-transporting ATPase subunit delta
MADLQAARRYAQAAFSIAAEANTVETWRAELQDVAAVLTESRMAPVLADSRLSLAEREAMLARALDVSPMVMNLAKLLVAKGRSPEARAVANAFARIADEAAGIAHAEITTAVPLSDDQLQAIASQLSRSLGKQVDAVGAVDPSIIGGIVLRVGDRLVDGSIRTRLKSLRQELQGAR